MPDLPARPPRGIGSKTDLTGPELKRALAHMGVSANHFSRLTGINPSRLDRMLAGKEDDLPLFVEMGLFILHNHPEYRSGDGVLVLPFSEWGR
jgi:hypothetical protein